MKYKKPLYRPVFYQKQQGYFFHHRSRNTDKRGQKFKTFLFSVNNAASKQNGCNITVRKS